MVLRNGALTPQSLKTVLRKAGFTGASLRTAWALAMRESGGMPKARSGMNADGTRDHGLFQLNDVHRRADWIDFSRIYDAEYQAKVVYRMTAQGTNFGSWGVGTTSWAGHLKKTAPATWRALNDRLDNWKAQFPA